MSLVYLIASIVMIRRGYRLSVGIMLMAAIIQLIADVAFVLRLLALV